jgi:hypothetical protein
VPSDFADAPPGPALLARGVRALHGNPETSLRKLALTARALTR